MPVLKQGSGVASTPTVPVRANKIPREMGGFTMTKASITPTLNMSKHFKHNNYLTMFSVLQRNFVTQISNSCYNLVRKVIVNNMTSLLLKSVHFYVISVQGYKKLSFYEVKILIFTSKDIRCGPHSCNS